MANNAYFSSAGHEIRTRPPYRNLGVLVVALSGLWATGLMPLVAAGRAPEGAPAAPRVMRLSADAGRRITTVTITTSDPVAYLTTRPDPLTLLVDLREADARGALSAVLAAKGVVAGGSVEATTAPDGTRVARVRIKLTQPAAHQVRSK